MKSSRETEGAGAPWEGVLRGAGCPAIRTHSAPAWQPTPGVRGVASVIRIESCISLAATRYWYHWQQRTFQSEDGSRSHTAITYHGRRGHLVKQAAAGQRRVAGAKTELLAISAEGELPAGGAGRAGLGLPPRRNAHIHVARSVLRVNGTAMEAGDRARVRDERLLSFEGGQDAGALLFDLRPVDLPMRWIGRKF